MLRELIFLLWSYVLDEFWQGLLLRIEMINRTFTVDK